MAVNEQFIDILKISVDDGDSFVFMTREEYESFDFGDSKTEIKREYKNVPRQYYEDTVEMMPEWNG